MIFQSGSGISSEVISFKHWHMYIHANNISLDQIPESTTRFDVTHRSPVDIQAFTCVMILV